MHTVKCEVFMNQLNVTRPSPLECSLERTLHMPNIMEASLSLYICVLQVIKIIGTSKDLGTCFLPLHVHIHMYVRTCVLK